MRVPLLAVLLGCSSLGAVAQGPSVVVLPSEQRIERDSNGYVRIRVNNVDNLKAYHVQVSYNPQLVRCRLVRFLGFLGTSSFTASIIDSANGTATADEAVLGPGSHSGSGDLVELRFLGLNNGTVPLTFAAFDFRDTLNNVISVTTQGGVIRVGPPNDVRVESGDHQREVWIRAYPNPFNPSTVLKYSTEQVGKFEIRIYSVLGEEVYAFDEHDLSSSRELMWYGQDENGLSLPSGTYVIRVMGAGAIGAAKVLLLR